MEATSLVQVDAPALQTLKLGELLKPYSDSIPMVKHVLEQDDRLFIRQMFRGAGDVGADESSTALLQSEGLGNRENIMELMDVVQNILYALEGNLNKATNAEKA